MKFKTNKKDKKETKIQANKLARASGGVTQTPAAKAPAVAKKAAAPIHHWKIGK